MAKHVISVCMFCFICATHSPCASHGEVTHGTYNYRSPLRDPGIPTLFQKNVAPREKDKITNSLPENGYIEKTRSFKAKRNVNNNFIHNIKKRDSNVDVNNKLSVSNNTNSSRKLDHDIYLKKIFTMFGDGDRMTMEGFQRLITKLDLIEKISKNSEDLLTSSPHTHSDNSSSVDDNITSESKMCIDDKALLTSIGHDYSNNNALDNNTFTLLCPALLYGMVGGKCKHEDVDSLQDSPLDNQATVWFYSTLAVILISACGVLGLAVIPVMQKTFYQPLLQFLVALAVGTLAGDALLHLLPHAMGREDNHGHEHADGIHNHQAHHDDNMWKGFTAMLGLIFFFFMERMITLGAKWRKTVQLKEKMPSRLKVMMPDGNPPTNPGEKQCKHKYSSFPMCYEEITMLDGQNEDHVFRLAGGTDSVESHNNTATTTIADMGSNSDVASLKVPRHKIETNQNMTECPGESNNVNCTEVNKMLTNETEKEDSNSLEYTVILREHESRHHGHSHAHGHVHSAPKDLSSVAWMVVMGDGLHNFTDGMAIGAAFASSIAGGFSTAVAVFCHELPHELGDFAMLLKAGMTMKQALFYNLLSSVLCLFGNAFGVWLGKTETASQWIFAIAAGMFLYIALVDMIPELSSGHEAEGTLFQCILHLGGLLLGFAIMTLIALYEHDLKHIFHEPV